MRPQGWHPAPSIEVRVVAPDASAVDIASSHFSHRLSEIVSQQTASRSVRETGRWHAGPARTLQWRGRTLRLGMVSADALRMVAAPEEGAGPGGEGGEEGDESEEEPPDSDMERQPESFDEDQY